MKTLKLLSLAAVIGLVGCGGSGSESDGGTSGTLTSGTYVLQSVTFTKDTCNIQSAPELSVGAEFGVTVSGNQITLWTASATKPTGLINGDEFQASANTTGKIDPSIDCTDTVTKTLNGLITGNDSMSGTYQFDDAVQSGTQCTEANLGFTPPTCQTVFSFTAAKKPGT